MFDCHFLSQRHYWCLRGQAHQDWWRLVSNRLIIINKIHIETRLRKQISKLSSKVSHTIQKIVCIVICNLFTGFRLSFARIFAWKNNIYILDRGNINTYVQQSFDNLLCLRILGYIWMYFGWRFGFFYSHNLSENLSRRIVSRQLEHTVLPSSHFVLCFVLWFLLLSFYTRLSSSHFVS